LAAAIATTATIATITTFATIAVLTWGFSSAIQKRIEVLSNHRYCLGCCFPHSHCSLALPLRMPETLLKQ
jgi:hypothetical protein